MTKYDFKKFIQYHNDDKINGKYKNHITLTVTSEDAFSLGKNFNKIRFNNNTRREDKDDVNNYTPVFYTQEPGVIESLALLLSDKDLMILYCAGKSIKVDKSFLNIDFDKYKDQFPEYHTSLAILEKANKDKGFYEKTISKIGSYFVMSKTDYRKNTLNIVTWLHSFGIPEKEIIYHIKKNVTLESQLQLDNLCNVETQGALTMLDKEKYDTLENWEKRLFYIVSRSFYQGPQYINFSFLGAYFVNALYELKKYNPNTEYIMSGINPSLLDREDFTLDSETLYTIIEKVTGNIPIKQKRKVLDSITQYQEEKGYAYQELDAAARLIAKEEEISGFVAPIALTISIIDL